MLVCASSAAAVHSRDVRLRVRYLLLGLLASCAPQAAQPIVSVPPAARALKIQLSNELQACVSLAPGNVDTLRNVVLLGARMRMLQSLAACACTSALLSYRVSLDDPLRSGVVGRFNTLNRELGEDEQVYILLATDEALLRPARTANVAISCSQGPQ